MTSILLKSAISELLNINNICVEDVQTIIYRMLAKKLDYADMFFQNIYSESWVLEDGTVKNGSFSIDKGVGVRAISGDKTGYAFSDDINLSSINDAAVFASNIAKSNQDNIIKIPWHNIGSNANYHSENPISSFDKKDKIGILQNLYNLAESKQFIKRVDASLIGTYEVILIVSSEGYWIADIRPLVRLNLSVVAEKNGRVEKAYSGCGGRYTYAEFMQNNTIEKLVNNVTREVYNNLDSVEAPAGEMPVVLGPGWPGVLLHEAVGHGLESDFIRKKTSVFTKLLGQRIAAPGVNVVDNGTLTNRRGSLNIDDEGTQTQETVLIEDGYLKGFLYDKLNAKLMGQNSTGNGRRENYAYFPIPRMTNTYMEPGNYDPMEIISSVKKGIYATNFGGGQVDITSGKFVFNLCEAFIIEDGKIKSPIAGATLIGSGSETLKHISMIGSDKKLDDGIGICGKDGQSVPVGVGQPTVKLENMIVGGTK